MATASLEGKVPIIVTGDDDFDDYKLMAKVLRKLTFPFDDVAIFTRGRTGWSYEHGRCQGAEFWATYWVTKRLGLLCVVHPDPKVKKSKRDDAQLVELLESAKRIVVFWDGYNEETENIIKKAKWMDLKVKVINYAEGI